MGINSRFNEDSQPIPGYSAAVPIILSQSNTQSYTGDAETISITGTKIVCPMGMIRPGSTFRFTLIGERTGTAGALALLIDINGTTAVTLTLPANAADEFMASFIVSFHTNNKKQNCHGIVYQGVATTEAFVSDYAAATVDVNAGATIQAKATLANGSDEVYVYYALVEYWQVKE
jgi:hypothetical protein